MRVANESLFGGKKHRLVCSSSEGKESKDSDFLEFCSRVFADDARSNKCQKTPLALLARSQAPRHVVIAGLTVALLARSQAPRKRPSSAEKTVETVPRSCVEGRDSVVLPPSLTWRITIDRSKFGSMVNAGSARHHCTTARIEYVMDASPAPAGIGQTAAPLRQPHTAARLLARPSCAANII